ncbi:hypothetical protein [Cryobacterium sp. TMT1-66-1]|uniref:hypothetical protein n=1 Tax=Cryobacterium sp. TMT1-66-1 TaxID=1259242 RepID=UPI00106CDA23|nr:hypothetical protein [Cryobacterium sp. TMT1-66-1]TFD04131.1 hypothetical protein E3T29_15875 [Cryobacterium sp. TMT1-66-1]
MLKEDGQFLKGPTSSIEPPVARRVRARLIAEGHVEQVPRPIMPAHSPTPAPIRSTPYPVPAPPGKRWDATEPFIAFKQPPPPPATPAEIAEAERLVRAARAEQRALLASQQAARDAGREEQKALRAARVILDANRKARLAGAKKEALQVAAGAFARRRQEEVDAIAKRRQEDIEKHAASIELGKPRAAEVAARIEEIARKGRARADRESAERDERGHRRRVNSAPPVPAISDEQARRNARRAIVARSDTRWTFHGISKQEREKWIHAGLRDDQAHIPAMCRAFGSRGWTVTPDHLKVVLLNGRTVRQEFEAGSNIVQVMDQLSPIRKRDFTGYYDTSLTGVIAVLRDFIPEKFTSNAAFPLNLEATGVPEIADYLLLLTRPSQDERTIDTFNRERRASEHNSRPGQRNPDRPGPAVKLYSEAHGVFRDPVLTRELLTNLPRHVLNRRLPFTNIINDALRDRQFYYLSPAATLTVEDDIDHRIPIPEDYELPSTTGFALLSKTDGRPGGRILLWSHGARELTAALLSIADIRAGLLEHPPVAAAEVGSVQGESGDQALALVAAIARAMRRPPSSDTTDRPIPAQRPHKAAPPGRPLRSPANDEDGPSDHVSLIYAPGETHEREPSKRSGRKAEKRWIVRRHLRLQFYPSSGERHPVWIEAHQSGAADGRLWLGDRVKVPRKGLTS